MLTEKSKTELKNNSSEYCSEFSRTNPSVKPKLSMGAWDLRNITFPLFTMEVMYGSLQWEKRDTYWHDSWNLTL